LDESALEPLRQLAKHVQITAIAVHDPLEQELPLAGRYVVADDLGRSALNTHSSSLRSHYRAVYEQQIADLTSALQGLRIPLIRMRTDEPPLPTLQRYFPARQTGR
jgi:uncharacterized protein (DUF58 family)